jgi:hypothetical protein
MAMTQCPHCRGGFFELREIEPSGSRYKMFFVQCSACGAPAGITEYYDAGSLIKKQEKVLDQIEKRLTRLEGQISQIAHAMLR